MRRRDFLVGGLLLSTGLAAVPVTARADLTDGDFARGIDKLLDVLKPIKTILDTGFTDLLEGIDIADPAAGDLQQLEHNYRAFLQKTATLLGSIERGLEIFDIAFPEEVTDELGKARRLFSTRRMQRLRRALRMAAATQEKVQTASALRLQQVQVMRMANKATVGYPAAALNVANELQALQLDALRDLTDTVNASHHAAIQEQARLITEERSALEFNERFMAPATAWLDRLEQRGDPPMPVVTPSPVLSTAGGFE